jgi:hypothetical protein
MSAIFAALSFCLVTVGAIFTFAINGGHVDRTNLGLTLLLIGGLAFVLAASQLWSVDHGRRR